MEEEETFDCIIHQVNQADRVGSRSAGFRENKFELVSDNSNSNMEKGSIYKTP